MGTVAVATQEKRQVVGAEVEEIYEQVFPGVAAFVGRLGGSFDDAKDTFHDALVIYYEATTLRDLTVTVSGEAYIIGIAKHLWIRKHKRDAKLVSLTPFERTLSIPEDSLPSVDDRKLLRLLETAGRRCMELLRAFYHRRTSVRRLAGELGYPNSHSLSVQKYKCLEKVRNAVKERSMSYEDFLA